MKRLACLISWETSGRTDPTITRAPSERLVKGPKGLQGWGVPMGEPVVGSRATTVWKYTCNSLSPTVTASKNQVTVSPGPTRTSGGGLLGKGLGSANTRSIAGGPGLATSFTSIV